MSHVGGSLPQLLQPLLLLLAALAVAQSARLPAERLEARRGLLLVGGQEVRQDERHGYIVRLHFLLDGRVGLLAGCGGTLISRRVVLTAAHCTALAQKGNGNVFVRVGAYNPLTDEALRKNKYSLRRVTRVVEHPGYQHLDESEPTSPNDLALLLLDKPVPDRFPAVRLPNATTPYPPDGTELHALGWGSTDSENTQPAYSLMDLELPAVSLELCRKQWRFAGAAPTLLRTGHVCAGLESQRNICFGDSGGPLLLRGASASEDVQLGVISFSFPTCALPGMPGVFTFIPQYRAWIDRELALLDPSPAPVVPVASNGTAVSAAGVAAPLEPATNATAKASSLEDGPAEDGGGKRQKPGRRSKRDAKPQSTPAPAPAGADSEQQAAQPDAARTPAPAPAPAAAAQPTALPPTREQPEEQAPAPAPSR